MDLPSKFKNNPLLLRLKTMYYEIELVCTLLLSFSPSSLLLSLSLPPPLLPSFFPFFPLFILLQLPLGKRSGNQFSIDFSWFLFLASSSFFSLFVLSLQSSANTSADSPSPHISISGDRNDFQVCTAFPKYSATLIPAILMVLSSSHCHSLFSSL